MKRRKIAWFLFAGSCVLAGLTTCTFAETCVTQSQMHPTERDALADAASSIAQKVQFNDQSGLRTATIPELAVNFNGIGGAVANVSPKLKGSTAQVEQVYVLDASMNKANPDGSAPDAGFSCVLNKGASEADFTISSLPPGKYAFAMVRFSGPSPWLVSMLLRQDGTAAPWKLAGLFPKSTTAAGHDGLWYWKEARTAAANKQPWIAYIYFQQAQYLLQPAGFVSSTHLDNLRIESQAALPPAIPNGVNLDNPLVVQDSTGTQYRLTALVPDDSLEQPRLDIAAHMDLDPALPADAAHQRNLKAISALIASHPELRTAFHGVWVFAEAPGQVPIANEAVMADIH
jgi:hypothetical protein